MMRGRRGAAALAAVVSLVACRAKVADSRVVTPWIRLPYELSAKAARPSLHAARASAYLAVAMHEAWAGDPASGLTSLGAHLNGLWSSPIAPTRSVDGATAAAEAARLVLDSLFPGFTARPDSLAAQQIGTRIRQRVRKDMADSSRAFGRAVAAAVLDWSKADYAGRTFVARNADECAMTPPAPAGRSRSTATTRRTVDAPPGTAALQWANLFATAAERRPAPSGVVLQAWVQAATAVHDAAVTAQRQAPREGIGAPFEDVAVASAAVPVLVAALGDSLNGFSAARDALLRDSTLGRPQAMAVQRGSDVGQCVGERVMGRLSPPK